MPIHIDTSDGQGNGILVATDRIVLITGDVGGAIVGTTACKILYKTIEVGIQEYVGIVQSQQG